MDPRFQIGPKSSVKCMQCAWCNRDCKPRQAHLHRCGGLIDHLQLLPGCHPCAAREWDVRLHHDDDEWSGNPGTDARSWHLRVGRCEGSRVGGYAARNDERTTTCKDHEEAQQWEAFHHSCVG